MGVQPDGRCDTRFTPLRDAFLENFAADAEVGAAIALVVDGAPVVDLWAGHTDDDRRQPWQRDTLVNVFSIGKAMTAICLHRLVERGAVDLDAPVAQYWPEFGEAGKEEVPVHLLLSHRAGLPAVRTPLADGSQLEWTTMTDALAATEPWWEPGTTHGYHVNTFGFLIGEIVRRVTGRSLGAFCADEVAGPLGADFHIGLAPRHHARVSDFLHYGPRPPLPDGRNLDERTRMVANTYYNPPGLSGLGIVNTPAWRQAEIPSTNGHSNARAVAAIYGALISGRAVLGPTTLGRAISEQVYGDDLVLGRPSRFGLGFQLTQSERPLGPNPRAFGHFGAGGSVGFADPDAGVAFAYTMNVMGPRWQNPKNRRLIDAVYASL